MSVQFGEEYIISRPDAAQIQRYGQLCLIANHCGGPCCIGDAAIALFVTNNHDRVRSGLAETRENQIDMQEGRGQIERRSQWLILRAAIGSVIGEIQRRSTGCDAP